MVDWFRDHALEVSIASGVMLLAGIFVAPWVIVRLPVDGLRRHNPLDRFKEHHPLLRTAIWLVRNVVGLVLVAAGVAMLVLPGQGILTILLGLGVMEFPGKRRIVHKILRNRQVFASMNWIRRKAHRPDLLPPD